MEGAGNTDDFVEVARAANGFEAAIWARNLDALGIESTTAKRGGVLQAIFFLGRVPVALLVPRKDHDRAFAYLKDNRFIR